MQKVSLVATKRDASEKLNVLRAARRIPAVVYGHSMPSQPLTLEYSDFLRVFRSAGKSHIVDLSIDGKAQQVLIYDVQFDPVSDEFRHVDFLTVSANEAVHVKIPLTFVGESAAVRDGAMLSTVNDLVELKCLPKDLVDSFEVDLSRLANTGDAIHIGDLGIDTKKYTIITPLTEVVVMAEEPKAMKIEEDEAPIVTEAADAPAAE
ncbi:MAG TPA: 50S ribosomal protein L25 [bacterium]|nr:50S ribosomal protein L25 [bacterium]